MLESKKTYHKQIAYVDCYRGGVKMASVGFAKIIRREDTSLLLHISDPVMRNDVKTEVKLMVGDEEMLLGEMLLIAGKGEVRFEHLEKTIPSYGEMILQMKPDPDTLYLCVLQSMEEEQEKQEKQETFEERIVNYDATLREETEALPISDPRESNEDFIEIESAESPPTPIGEPEPSVIKMQPDKWRQLTEKFPWTRPFRDERWYLLLDLPDLILLPKQYYPLVDNSFLLHGYYNYGHLILARICRRGTEKFYIGVPGNFYEKEKQVAVLFGFESFEPKAEPAGEGDFGYYMIGVDI